MKAVRYHGIRQVRCEEVPKPVPGPGEALIRVACAGICGSDLHIYNRGMFIQNIPEIMGHEFSGVVEAVGSPDLPVQPGDLVVGNPMVPCGSCPGCRAGKFNTCSELGFIGEVRPGGFGEYIALPADRLVKAKPGTDPAALALAEPLAVALNVCERMKPLPEERIAIIGAGPIGLLTLMVLKAVYGASHVTVVNRSEPRRRMAEALGADLIFGELPEDQLFDAVVEAAGKQPSFEAAVAHTAPGGRICMVSIFEDGFTVDLNAIVAGEIALVGANAYEHRHIEEAVRLIEDGALDVTPLITGRYGLAECAEAFEALCGGDRSAAKILFDTGKE
ncbi:MAG: zinc-binding dehydrogenase [Anaerovoracaceae bacterium]